MISPNLINVTDYYGVVTMRHQEDVHEILETGHLVFEIDLTKELNFTQHIEDKFLTHDVAYNGEVTDLFRTHILKVAQNPLGQSLQIVYDTFFQEKAKIETLLEALRRTLPQHHPKHPNYQRDSVQPPKLTRQKRQLPFLSLGLGVMNTIHLAVLDGVVAGLGEDVQKTMMRVDNLAKISAATAESVVTLLDEQKKIIETATHTSQTVAATLLSVSMLSAMQQAIRHLQTVANGIQALLDFRLPLSYFDLDEVKATFDKYVTLVRPQNLEPINLSFLQLFQNHASFVLVEKEEEDGVRRLVVSVMVDIPLMALDTPMTSVYSMEPTIVPINGSYWSFHADGLLLTKPDGAMAEVGREYLTDCHDIMGPMGRMCVSAPTLDEETTCLAEIYSRSTNLTACHPFMKIMPPGTPHINQRKDGSFLTYSPSQRHAHVDCPGEAYQSRHDSTSLFGLQQIVIGPGCRLRVGDFHGFVLDEPDIKPVGSFVIGENATQLLAMLNVNYQVLLQDQDDLAILAQENAHVLDQAELTLAKVTALVNRPLHRAATQVLPFILMGISGILILMILSCVTYCCCRRRCQRRKPGPPPKPTKRKPKAKGKQYTPAALGIEHLMIDLEK